MSKTLITSNAFDPSAPKAQALVLAAGRGERMRPLSDATPKPLLKVHERTLIEHTLHQLGKSGLKRVAINTAWLGEQIRTHLNNPYPIQLGPAHVSSLDLCFSCEDLDFGGALETGGGIVRALPLLEDVFWVVAGDVHAPEFNFPRDAMDRFSKGSHLAHLWLVPNPPQHPRGDFWIQGTNACRLEDASTTQSPKTYTFSTIALYKKAFFSSPYCSIPTGNPHGLKAPLAPWLKEAMKDQRVGASLFEGQWTDVGTPERLAQLNACTPSHHG
jgi:MurNAc alpha-1-phosphate uridylyltransferase